jgi:hypothetical protein
MAPEMDVKGNKVAVVTRDDNVYISLTDMAKHKNPSETSLVISHWMSTRYTVELMGIWERLNNPGFNTTEFSSIKNESGSRCAC